jgi:hypothetical protein
MGPPRTANIREDAPLPASKTPRNGDLPSVVLSLRAPLFVLRTQHLPSLRVHQMRLCARKARHLDVGEFVFGVISGPSLDRAPMLFRGRPTVSPRALHSIIAHRLNCICRNADAVTPNTAVSRQRLRPSAMLSKNCAPSGPSPLGCRSVMSASTKTKSTDCMTMTITRCARL